MPRPLFRPITTPLTTTKQIPHPRCRTGTPTLTSPKTSSATSLAQLFAIQVQVAILLVQAPPRSGVLENLLGGLFSILPTLSQAIDLAIPTLDNIISTADQLLAIPIVYTIPALIPIIATTTINVPLSIIYDPFPTIGPSLTADLLALAQLTDPVAILDVVADLQLSVQTGLPRASVTGLVAAATLSPPTGRLQASAAGAQAPLTDSLEAGAVLATGRSQASAPGLPQTLRPGEVVQPAGQSLASILRPTTLPQNLLGSGQLSIAGEAVQPTQAPLGPSQLPPPTSLPRASLAGALHATAPDPPEASIAQPPLSRATVFPHAIYGLPLHDAPLPPGQSQPCTVQPQFCTAQNQPCSQDLPPHLPTPVVNVLPVPCTRGCVVGPAPTVTPVPIPLPVPNAVSVQVVTTDGPLHDDPPLPSSDDGNDPPPLQGDNINDIDNDPSYAPADNVKDGPFAPLVVPGGNVDNTNDAASSLLPSTPNTTLVPTGAAAVYASSSPPLLLSCFAHPATSCFLFSFSLVVWGSVGIVL